MTGRAAAVRNRVLVTLGAVLLAWLFGWTSDEALLMLLVAAVAALLAVTRAVFGGVVVLAHWLLRYRAAGVGLRALGDVIGDHRDDMRRAGLVVPQRSPRRFRRSRPQQQRRARPDLLPRLHHRPFDGGIVVGLEAVRAGMSQEDVLRALPRLRSAWGVDVVRAETRPGGRLVEITIPMTPQARRAAQEVAGAAADAEGVTARDPYAGPAPETVVVARRPPDAPPVRVVPGTTSHRTGAITTRRPPVFEPVGHRPGLAPDEHGNYELDMLPLDAARTFAPRSLEERADDAGRSWSGDDASPGSPRTDEIGVVEAPVALPERGPAPRVPSRRPQVNGGDRRVPTALDHRRPLRPEAERNPTDVDERDTRLGGVHWRTGKQR